MEATIADCERASGDAHASRQDRNEVKPFPRLGGNGPKKVRQELPNCIELPSDDVATGLDDGQKKIMATKGVRDVARVGGGRGQ